MANGTGCDRVPRHRRDPKRGMDNLSMVCGTPHTSRSDAIQAKCRRASVCPMSVTLLVANVGRRLRYDGHPMGNAGSESSSADKVATAGPPLQPADLPTLKPGDVVLYNPTAYDRMKMIPSAFDDVPNLTPMRIEQISGGMYIRAEGYPGGVHCSLFALPSDVSARRTAGILPYASARDPRRVRRVVVGCLTATALVSGLVVSAWMYVTIGWMLTAAPSEQRAVELRAWAWIWLALATASLAGLIMLVGLTIKKLGDAADTA